VNLLFEYINYRWNAKGRHGVHSPFVYDLIDKGFSVSPDYDFLQKMGSIRKRYKNDHRLIEVNDAGAGSKVLGKQRKVSQIYAISASKRKKSRLLFQLARHYKPKNVLEMGTSLGVGTFSLYSGCPDSKVISVDACGSTQKVAIDLFQELKIRNVSFVNSTFDHFFDGHKGDAFDVVFVDGHHSGLALLRYMEKLESFTHQDTIFILDDIRWSDDMYSAFKQLIAKSDYHVSLDLFDIGIVAKRPQQEKEHFVLKY
jgi:predicted O-methyltransferase YrrM